MSDISSSVKKYVDAKDVKAVRVALTTIGYIADYESFKNFKTSTEYAVNNLVDLFEPDNNESIDLTVSLDSYKKIVKQLMNNFSEKKYAALIEVGTKLYSNETKKNTVKNDYSGKTPRNKEELDPFLTQKTTGFQNVMDIIIQNPIPVLLVIIVLVIVIILVAK